ncbi:MAG: hypothetical protein J5755_01300, partial [Clostridia bacterium]|nr:hypothetical protein [Clostridia bacterium]
MKKWIWIIVICCALVAVLCACGDKGNSGSNQEAQLAEFEGVSFAGQTLEYDGLQHELTVLGAPSDATVTYETNKGTLPGTYNARATVRKEGYRDLTLNAVLRIDMPSEESVVNAREAANESNEVAYDFSLNLAGSINIAGYSGTANANYDGKYRYNKTTGQVSFVRTTSGILLYDATEYIIDQDSNRIKVTQNDQGKIKSIGIALSDDEELTLINKPFAALVDALNANNLQNIRLAPSGSDYLFEADIRLSTNNALINKALNIIARQGTNLSMKDVSFTNPVSGLVLKFNLGADHKLNDFSLSAAVQFPVKGVDVALTLTYSQVGSTTAISLPRMSNVIINRGQIASEMSTINNAIYDLSQSEAYSLDLLARNEFDPGWNVRATVDKYTARMYKHTYELDDAQFTAFNHSYEFKTHHEEDGAETYKYTIGNIQDGSAHLVSRKGSNTITALGSVTAESQFNYLTGAFLFDADNVDCIQKETSGGVTVYTVYLKENA